MAKIGEVERAMRAQREALAAKPVKTSGLTAVERTRLRLCESVIEGGLAAFLEVGAALAEVKGSRLYRETHGTFADYCRDRWGMGKSRAYQLIDASAIVGEMSTTVDKPESEWPVRPLKKLPPEERAGAWEEAVEVAGGQPTQAQVEQVVESRLPPPETSTAVDKPEPPDQPDEEDELVRALEENAKLHDLVESLQSDDTARELTNLSRKYTQLDGRLGQALRTLKEAERTATYCQGELRKIREALGVEKNGEILPAIKALRA